MLTWMIKDISKVVYNNIYTVNSNQMFMFKYVFSSNPERKY
jgi:hypothetical protein